MKSKYNFRLTSEELEKILKEENNRTGKLIETLAYGELNLMLIGEFYCLGNDCAAAVFMYNGGEEYFELNTYDFDRLLKGLEIEVEPIEDIEENETIQEYLNEE